MRRWLPVLALLLIAGCTGPGSEEDDSSDRGSDVASSADTEDEARDVRSDTSGIDSVVFDSRTSIDGAGTDSNDDTNGGGDGGDGGVDCDNPDSDWLFCEDFEYADGDWKKWFEDSDFVTARGGDDRGRIELSNAHSTSGDWSVHMPASKSSNYQGANLTWYACKGNQETNCDLRGYDTLYFRTRVRFAKDHDYVHHFLSVGGRDRFWPYGSAGCMPDGESFMGTTVDFEEDSHETFFYTYHLDMNCDTNCGDYLNVDKRCQQCKSKGFPTCTQQKQCCWGDNFAPDPPVALPVGEWFCMEMMMTANTPGKSDGVMAYWVDGKLGHRKKGMRWRTTSDLQLDHAVLQHYIAESDADAPNRVWFDDVVVSTERIGCP